MSKRDFLAMEDWSQSEIESLLDLAARVKRGEILGGLERKVLALVLLDPSLRTRTSFETAMFLHGGHAIVLEPGRGSWALETQIGAVMNGTGVEHLVDAARVLGRYADFVGVRSFPKGTDWQTEREDRVVRDFAHYCGKPLINLESVRRHPCQGLADALTLREKLGETRRKKLALTWAWHPKPLPTAVPASAAIAGAMMGMDISLARPKGYDLDSDDLATIRERAAATGGSLKIVDQMEEAIEGADAVYVKSWGSLEYFGRPEDEKANRQSLKDWRMTDERVKLTKAGKGVVMHCLPVRRNVEIDDAVLDGANSAVIDQAENRLHVQRALLLSL